MKTATAKTLKRMEALTWALIFGGLFALALGLATQRVDHATGWTLVVLGVLAAAAGAALVFVRARLVEAPAGPGAQSDA